MHKQPYRTSKRGTQGGRGGGRGTNLFALREETWGQTGGAGGWGKQKETDSEEGSADTMKKRKNVSRLEGCIYEQEPFMNSISCPEQKRQKEGGPYG